VRAKAKVTMDGGRTGGV